MKDYFDVSNINMMDPRYIIKRNYQLFKKRRANIDVDRKPIIRTLEDSKKFDHLIFDDAPYFAERGVKKRNTKKKLTNDHI